MDNLYWNHPTLEIHTTETLLVERAWGTCHQWKQERCFKSVSSSFRASDGGDDGFGRLFSWKLFREWLASKDVRWGEAAWRIGVLDKVSDVITNSATRAARRAPHDTFLTTAQKHTTNFTSDEGIHPLSCSSKTTWIAT